MEQQNRFAPNAKPNFCIITPTAYLKRYAIQTNTHLALAHLVDTDQKYCKFYRERSENGDTIILDNSAFELPIPYQCSKLVSLAKDIGAHAIVLPDYPGQHSYKTTSCADQHISEVKDNGFATFFVPQSKIGDLEDWIIAYQYASHNPNIDIIGMSILGCPTAIPHIPSSYARVVITQILIDRGIVAQKYHHYLGLNAGPALEIPSLIKMGVLNSCDSSNPVWMAILGHQYTTNSDSYLSVSKVKKHVQFDYPLTQDHNTLDRIQLNIDLTLNLFNK